MTKQKAGEGSKAGQFNASKGQSGNLREKFDFKNVKLTGEAASPDQEATDGFPDTIKKITEKGFLPEQVFNADESALFGGDGGCCATKDIYE